MLFWQSRSPVQGPEGDAGILVGEVLPMVAVVVISTVLAVYCWRSRSAMGLYMATAFAALEGLIGLFWVIIGLLGGPLVAFLYLFYPLPAPAALAWATLAVFMMSLRSGRSSSTDAGRAGI